jgi:hypothetical protein
VAVSDGAGAVDGDAVGGGSEAVAAVLGLPEPAVAAVEGVAEPVACAWLAVDEQAVSASPATTAATASFGFNVNDSFGDM